MTGRRTSARVVLLDDDGAVLLLCGSDPALDPDTAPRWWFTVGGRVRRGEALTAAAVREVAEETGLAIGPDDLTGPVWRREAVIRFNGAVLDSEEFYFVLRTSRFEPSPAARTALEHRYLHGHRWCDAGTIRRLAAGGQTVYPLQLADLLPTADALVRAARRDPGSASGWPVGIR